LGGTEFLSIKIIKESLTELLIRQELAGSVRGAAFQLILQELASLARPHPIFFRVVSNLDFVPRKLSPGFDISGPIRKTTPRFPGPVGIEFGSNEGDTYKDWYMTDFGISITVLDDQEVQCRFDS
jgi:hypothetical protein